MKPKRIVFSTWGSLGDLHPYLALAVELSRRGHRTAIATLPSWRERVEQAGVSFHPVGPDIPQDEKAAREMVRRILDSREGVRYLFTEVLGPSMRESYEALLAVVRADGGADLLVTHAIPFTGPIVAEVTGVRWASAIVQPLAFISAHDPPTPAEAPWIRPLLTVHPLIARVMLRIGGARISRWLQPVAELRKALGLPRGANPIFEGQHAPGLVLALFSPLLGPLQPDFPPQTRITGFPFYDAAAERPPSPALLRFLDSGEPPILFTLGSSAVWVAGNFYRTSIEAAVEIGRRAVLLAGEDAERLQASSLPASIMAVDYAPHSAVMPRAALTVHQGGIGTTGQALRAGRPMLVVPFGQDQPDNARRCVELGVAGTLSRRAYSTDRVARELARLLEDPAFATRASEVGASIDAERGTTAACDAIESILE